MKRPLYPNYSRCKTPAEYPFIVFHTVDTQRGSFKRDINRFSFLPRYAFVADVFVSRERTNPLNLSEDQALK